MTIGIYKIENQVNGKLYIGSSSNLKERKTGHFSELRRGTHGNKHLQRAFNLYTESNFEFSVLENCTVSDLILREQYWIDSFDWDQLYNIRKKADSNQGLNKSEEVKRKMSIVAKGKPKSKEHIQKIREARAKQIFSRESILKRNSSLKGHKFNLGKKQTPERVQHRIQSIQKQWLLMSPDHKQMTITNLKQFCRENNLCVTSMYKVCKGQIPQYKGWRLP